MSFYNIYIFICFYFCSGLFGIFGLISYKPNHIQILRVFILSYPFSLYGIYQNQTILSISVRFGAIQFYHIEHGYLLVILLASSLRVIQSIMFFLSCPLWLRHLQSVDLYPCRRHC